jgi:RNA polymerase sigma factor for flagellar operon FliA
MSEDAELWRAYRASRDPKLRDRLVERHLPIVKYTAAWVAGRLPSHLHLDDLYSAGMLGFLGAIEDYDPDRSVEFATYARPRIRGAIFDELRRLDYVPRRVRQQLREAQQTADELRAQLDREPTDEEVAAKMGLDVGEYRRLLGEGVTLFSLDATSTVNDDVTVLDGIDDASARDPLDDVLAGERREILGRLIDALPPRDQHVLALYYHEELTMQEIGAVLGVTESRISQIHSSAILKLRTALARRRKARATLAP